MTNNCDGIHISVVGQNYCLDCGAKLSSPNSITQLEDLMTELLLLGLEEGKEDVLNKSYIKSDTDMDWSEFVQKNFWPQELEDLLKALIQKQVEAARIDELRKALDKKEAVTYKMDSGIGFATGCGYLYDRLAELQSQGNKENV